MPAEALAGPAAEAASAFLSLFLREEGFALPLAAVQEVIRLPELAPVPGAPASLAGLANLRGTVLPVVDLRRLLRREAAPPTGATRVLVLGGEAPFGLVVDRVGRLLGVAADRLEPAAAGEEEAAGGMIRGEAGEAAIRVLEPARLLRRDFARAARPALAPLPAAPIITPLAAPAPAPVATRLLLGFAAAGQDYALPVEAVEEIAPAPAPGAMAEAEGLGVIAHRGRLLPLLSLRALLGLPPAAEGEERRRLVVVRLEGLGAAGLVVDRQGEVLRVPATLVDPVPPLLARRRPGLEVAAICRLEGGRRLVAVLSPEQLFRLEGLRGAAANATGREEAGMEGNAAAMPEAEAQFLVFRLGAEAYAVPIGEVEEVLRLPEGDLTPVPKAPGLVEGVVNLRGAVLPVLDGRRRFGLAAGPATGRERIMVHRAGSTRAGLLVDAVTEVLRVPRAAVGPAPALAGDQPSALVAGVVSLAGRARPLLVLDTARLLEGEEAGALAAGLAVPE